ncbi:hypothetical protein GOZ78_03490 [Agrobacterium vitis]|uniref:hypothetical protein n=1 Tax=Agrobacterium vitis TaxID=373 RepID=UPI0008DC096B|nr:hypothetical protein [Agrobacterium vitis]MUO84776.1 hypothetical protein [Agrobacterium vitis]MUZ80783.1 hypothetical protein [Agrobacterium vitis]MVA09082.1 hypothetical protein [Agrobacterium vitis]NSY12398.1 hypothetical protein [Agrobacterium vitis]NSY22227.1 hypothetical protein [Agrobacterium vitis]
MAHIKYDLVSAGRPVMLSNTRIIKFFNYATDHTKAEVLTAGFFNASRDDLTPHSIINAVVDCDGTPEYVRIKVATVPATGNVTVTDVTGDTTAD